MNSTLTRYLSLYGREYAPAALWADLDEAEQFNLRRRAARLRRALAFLGEL